MKTFSQKLQGFNATDEWYTPSSAVEKIIPYLPKRKTIWCPFDKKESEFVKVFTNAGYNVICSHIDDGKDFFTYKPQQDYDYIISNPPYSKRNAVYERLFELQKPFAMLVNWNGFFDCAKRFNLFCKYGVQFFIPYGRIKFTNNTNDNPLSPPFHTVFACWNLLPHTIIFEQNDMGLLKNDSTRKQFAES